MTKVPSRKSSGVLKSSSASAQKSGKTSSSGGQFPMVGGGAANEIQEGHVEAISIEYCGICNYRPIAAGLPLAIKAATGIQAEPIHSQDMEAFEVWADRRLIFSKKQSGRFPENAEIVAAIQALERT
jgi:selT/selW/selH-like putative selenoprotein